MSARARRATAAAVHRAREAFPAERRRLIERLGGRDPVQVLRRTPAVLSRLVAEVPPRRLRRPMAPGKWSVLEVLVHLADAEIAFGWRLRRMIAEPGARLDWWDQDAWASRLAYRSRGAREALASFGAMRSSSLAVLAGVPRRRWSRCHGVHDVRGRITLLDLVRQEAGHDLSHAAQIRRSLAGPRTRRGA